MGLVLVVGVGVEQGEGLEGALVVEVEKRNEEEMVLVSSMVVLGLRVDLGPCFCAFFFLGGAESQIGQGWNLVACIFLLGGCGGLCPCCSSSPALFLLGSGKQVWPKVSDTVLSVDQAKEVSDG